MTKKPAVLIGGTAILIAIGFAAGFGVGQQRAVEEGRRGPGVTSNSTPGSGSAVSPMSDSARSESPARELDGEKLRERVVELENDLRIAREQSGKGSAPAPGADAARRAFEEMLALETGNFDDPEQIRTLIESLSRLDLRLARDFVERFHNAAEGEGGKNERFVSARLALMCGGPDAANFLQKFLNDPSMDAKLRARVLDELAPTGGGFFSIRRLPVSESLGTTAMTLVRSDNVDDRRGGAGLLGGLATSASRVELTRLLADPDNSVKYVAVRSLGLVGDQTTRKLLEPYAAQSADPSLRKLAAAAIKDLEQSPR